MNPDEKLSLINIKEGAAIEMFDLALEKVFLNIRDINTTLDEREIQLTMKIKPSDCRTLAGINFFISKIKLANQGRQACNVDIKLDSKGKPYGRERERQLGLNFVPQNVTEIDQS